MPFIVSTKWSYYVFHMTSTTGQTRNLIVFFFIIKICVTHLFPTAEFLIEVSCFTLEAECFATSVRVKAEPWKQKYDLHLWYNERYQCEHKHRCLRPAGGTWWVSDNHVFLHSLSQKKTHRQPLMTWSEMTDITTPHAVLNRFHTCMCHKMCSLPGI